MLPNFNTYNMHNCCANSNNSEFFQSRAAEADMPPAGKSTAAGCEFDSLGGKSVSQNCLKLTSDKASASADKRCTYYAMDNTS